jgi:hypothetical protein
MVSIKKQNFLISTQIYSLQECTIMVVWNMVMVGMVGVAMVAEDVAVHGVVLSGDEDEAMVPRRLGIMTTVNMMHHLPHAVSMRVHHIQVSGYG